MDALAPFSCTYSPHIPELLQKLNCSLAITTYQAGKVIFISPKDRDHLIQLPRQFTKPMGMALQNNTMALATLNEVVVLSNNTQLAQTYPKQPGVYDGLFIPRATYYTGEADIHDLHWTDKGLLAVNTKFSCLSYINHDHSFTPAWKPDFVSSITGEDRCHLNGLAFDANGPRYVTVLGKTDTQQGWREKKATGGCIIDITTNEIVAENLPMPHSPRLYDGRLYVLLSATGELAEIDTKTKSYKVLKQLDGFVRGMDRMGDYIFIGLSKLRQTSQAFADLPIAKRSIFCGIVVLHLPTNSITGFIKYENSVEEIYDVKVLPGMQRPGIMNHEKPDFRMAISTPEKTFWGQITSHDKA
jgi:uncharacterized protein (TIGR03032 family)